MPTAILCKNIDVKSLMLAFAVLKKQICFSANINKIAIKVVSIFKIIKQDCYLGGQGGRLNLAYSETS